VWPSGRLHSDYMSEVSKTTASDPVHNVMLDVELIFDVCISDVRYFDTLRIFRRHPISNARSLFFSFSVNVQVYKL